MKGRKGPRGEKREFTADDAEERRGEERLMRIRRNPARGGGAKEEIRFGGLVVGDDWVEVDEVTGRQCLQESDDLGAFVVTEQAAAKQEGGESDGDE